MEEKMESENYNIEKDKRIAKLEEKNLLAFTSSVEKHPFFFNDNN
uniref:Uncharacterized protein n=1 Tax=Meloidogyne enterolobii TaxID=390850 RepID=A0A6V7WP79_MELEN|nr:unnamed protein product [Meloidogyne enterolobii]